MTDKHALNSEFEYQTITDMEEIAAGLDALDAAGVLEMAAGASDMTRGVDAMAVAGRTGMLSDVVAEAGVSDVVEGAELLVASENIAVQSALVSALAEEDLLEAMEMGAISGQLRAVGEVVWTMNMPVLADVLEEKAQQLQSIAVDTIMRFGATRALSEAMAETGEEVADLGAVEMTEGLVRMAAAEGLADRSEELEAAGAELVMAGMVEMAAAEELQEPAKDLVAEDVAEVTEEAADLAEADLMSRTSVMVLEEASGDGSEDASSDVEEPLVEEEASVTGLAEASQPAVPDDVSTFHHKLAYIEGIGQEYSKKLAEIGIDTPKTLLERGATPKGRQEIIQRTGISGKLILKWVNYADLYRIKGIGSQYAELLEAAGVDTVPELAQRNPTNLHAKLGEINEERKHVRQMASKKQVENWVAQAKELPRVIRY